MVININSSEVVVFTNKLEKLGGKLLPKAVNSALNKVALDVKKNTMPAESRSAFTVRQGNFFKANSRVEFSKATTIDKAQSTVGFRDLGGNNYAVRDLEEQEHGGTIEKKSFIPTSAARGGSNAKNVRTSLRLKAIKKIVAANKQKGNSEKQQFIRAVYEAGVRGFVLGHHGTLWRIDGISRKRIRKTAVYRYKKNRDVRVSATRFMEKASMKSAQLLPNYFIKAAEYQIKNLRK